jgi:hypothetical protein
MKFLGIIIMLYYWMKRMETISGKMMWHWNYNNCYDYQTFEDKSHHLKVIPPNGYKKICVHFLIDLEHEGRHKVRLVADGHLTEFF